MIDLVADTATTLTEQCAAVPNGEIVRLHGEFRSTRTVLYLKGRRDLTIDCDDATLHQYDIDGTNAAPVLRISGCTNVCVIHPHIVGPNTAGADGVVNRHENRGGIAIGGNSQHVLVADGSIDNVWGDFLLIGDGPGNAHIGFAGMTCRQAGRHGIAVRLVHDLIVANSTFTAVRRLFFDHEPMSAALPENAEGIDGLLIENCTSPEGGLARGWFQLRPNSTSFCRNITVRNHVLTRGHYKVIAQPGGVTRDHLTLENLRRAPDNPSPPAQSTLLTIGGWTGLRIHGIEDVVRYDPALAAKITNCPDAHIDLSGITRN